MGHTVESYISQHTTTRFSHGICPDCMASEVNPQFGKLETRQSGDDSGSD